MNVKRKLFLAGPTLGLLTLGAVQCTVSPSDAPATVVQITAADKALLDSTVVLASGQVGAGGTDPLLAHVSGRVRQIFFAGGEYVHRGQLLVKLDSRNYVLAPHDGFLGPLQVHEGQRVGRATPITTLSRRRHLMVVLRLHQGLRNRIEAGDSVRVWVATRPTRVVTGIVGPLPPATDGDFSLEIALPLRTPFRLGEQAVVRLHVVSPNYSSPVLAPPVATEKKLRR